ncbi:MAG: phosphate regulon sensor histidine kinase PhoR [Pseudohongiellaceae bacterium]
MLRDWRSAMKKLLLLLGLLLLAGLVSGQTPWVIAGGLCVYLIYTMLQLRRLHSWLYSPDNHRATQPPESYGLWGDVFDGIYQLQRRERDATQYLKNIIDRAQESTAALEIAVIMINRRGHLEWWNPAAERLLGLHGDHDRNQPVINLLRQPEFVEYFETGEYSRPLPLESPLSRERILEYQITWFGEGERLMLVRDITQLHRLETMRRDFAGNVSHELRTPITVITGYLETLLDNREGLPERWGRPLEQMYQQSQRMENIIRDLLTLTQLETKSVSRQRTAIDISALLNEIRGDAEQLFIEKQHHFLVECTLADRLQGNRNELYSAVSNLVFNAAKYTPAGGRITLSCQEESSRGIAISVADNGPGIPAQHIPRLTERFYRVDESRSTDTGGTGLGLAIVKHVLARHSATLEILSTPGKGSRFICHFPAQRVMH